MTAKQVQKIIQSGLISELNLTRGFNHFGSPRNLKVEP